jgi:hypothetical protein
VATSPVFVDNFKDLVASCISFYEENRDEISLERVRLKRAKLSGFAEAFHKDCGTLTPSVQKRLEDLRNGNCLLLMTAHQPNFFAYGGVLRKATLNFVLAKKLEEVLKVPVVSFFGIADQDFTDDRWVKSALLPDVERRGGVLELRFDLPEKLLLNKVAKPSRQVLNGWRAEVERWFNCKLGSIERFCKSFGLEYALDRDSLAENFEEFWKIVEDAHGRAEVFSDFNAFIMSKVVNEAWGYDTVFSRFSECQQIFEEEFRFLLSHFEKYSQYTKEAVVAVGNPEEGVYEREYETIPFWYHCDCGSKARLMARREDGVLVGSGECLRCRREYEMKFGSDNECGLSGIVSRISARSLSMPLIFFNGLKVGCYVGGAGGKKYLQQASLVARNMGMSFPPVVIWRPKDVYFGVGQLEALMTFRRLSSSFDFSKLQAVKAALEEKVAIVQGQVDELELRRKEIAKNMCVGKEDAVERMKALSSEQNKIRKETNFSLMVRDLKLLKNIDSVMSLHSCMVDYAVNVGLKATSEQWMAFLTENGSFCSDVALKTGFQDFVPKLQQLDSF